jgi:uncharacterized protein (TIGR03000 family)
MSYRTFAVLGPLALAGLVALTPGPAPAAPPPPAAPVRVPPVIPRSDSSAFNRNGTFRSGYRGAYIGTPRNIQPWSANRNSPVGTYRATAPSIPSVPFSYGVNGMTYNPSWRPLLWWYPPDISTPGPADTPVVPPAKERQPIKWKAPDHKPGDRAVHVTVNVPAGAEVWFGDYKTKATGKIRQFQSPALSSDELRTYTIRARWKEGGREVTQTQRISVLPGEQVRLTFPKASGGE